MRRYFWLILALIVVLGTVWWTYRPQSDGVVVRGSWVLLPSIIPFATFTPTSPHSAEAQDSATVTLPDDSPAVIPLDSPADRGRWETEKRVLRALEEAFCPRDTTMLYIEDVTFDYQGNWSVGTPDDPILEVSDFLHYQEQLPPLYLETFVDFLTLPRLEVWGFSLRVPSGCERAYRSRSYRPSTSELTSPTVRRGGQD